MGKNKQRFNKKQSVRFTLVPGFDENGKPITLYRPVEQHKSKLNSKQRQKIIQEISDQQYDQIQINGKKVSENQIPAFVLQQIRGRKDLVFNQKSHQKQPQVQGDLYEVMDAEDYSQGAQQFQDQEWIQQEQIIEQQNHDDMDEQFDDDEWSEQQNKIQTEEIDQGEKKNFVLKQEDFPTLNKVNIDGKDYELTEEQIKLLDVLIPEDYQKFEIKGLKFQKYDQFGLPLSKKNQYEDYLATGKQGVVDTYVFVPQKPVDLYDNDLKPSEITTHFKQIQDALNYEGEEEAYEELEDDFFSKMIKDQIQINKKIKKQKKLKKVSNNIKPEPREITEKKLPKVLVENNKNQNVFAKYDQLDDEYLNQQLTDQMLQKALNDFENNLQPQNTKLTRQIQEQEQDQMLQYNSRANMSMNYSQIQNREEYFGKDGQLDWRCLSKKQKKQYMKTKIIRDFYDEIREREIQDKIKGKKNVTAEELHLKTLVKHLTFEEDHVMRKALEEHAKQVVDLDQASDHQTSSQQQDIVEYRQRTSVISSNLNEISEPSKKKKKKNDSNAEQKARQLEQLSATLSQLKIVPEKRNKKETSQQRKQRKEKLKDMKKNKRELKKQFAEKLTQERRKQFKMNKPSDPLHKVAYVKII